MGDIRLGIFTFNFILYLYKYNIIVLRKAFKKSWFGLQVPGYRFCKQRDVYQKTTQKERTL